MTKGTAQKTGAFADRPRRVIAKVEHHLGERFSRVGFIVTTLAGSACNGHSAYSFSRRGANRPH
jgi:hypothetical protein